MKELSAEEIAEKVKVLLAESEEPMELEDILTGIGFNNFTLVKGGLDKVGLPELHTLSCKQIIGATDFNRFRESNSSEEEPSMSLGVKRVKTIDSFDKFGRFEIGGCPLLRYNQPTVAPTFDRFRSLPEEEPNKVKKDKIIVTGSGKCGTSYLMRLFSELGMDTGWTSDEAAAAVEKQHDFPFEWPIHMGSAPGRPMILKHPMMVRWLEDAAAHWNWNVQWVFGCVRDPEAVAAHMYQQEQDTPRPEIPGYYERVRFLKSEEEMSKEDNLEFLRMSTASATGDLMYLVEKMEVPFSLILFPRSVTDPEYLYRKLVIDGPLPIPFDDFMRAFNAVADAKKVHY